MSRFTTHTSLRPFEGADGLWTWANEDPLVWEIRSAGQSIIITVPAGFSTDLGTVPWWARFLINPGDPQLALAFLLHDWLLVEFGPACQPFAASQLYDAMRALKVPIRKRKLIAAAVVFTIDDW